MTTAAPAQPATATDGISTSPSGRRLRNEVEPLLMPESEKARNVVELIHRSVERIPDKEALRWKRPKDEGGEWTSRSYAEFWDWVTRTSLGLKGLGIKDGDAVCIMSRTRPEWLVADIGAWALGAVSCPIYPQTEPGQAAFILNNTNAVAVFVENPQMASKVAAVRDQVPSLRHVIVIDPGDKSTEGMVTHARRSPKELFLVATEVGILHRLEKEIPDKRFMAADRAAVCKYMKQITLRKLHQTLLEMSPTVEVEPELADRARQSIDRMLAVAV